MKNEDVQLIMGTVDFVMESLDHAIYFLINHMFDSMETPQTPAVALSEGSFFDNVE